MNAGAFAREPARGHTVRPPGESYTPRFQSSIEFGVLFFAAAIGSFLLFIPPVVGIADQRDFGRVFLGVGLRYPASLPDTQRYFFFFQKIYQNEPLHRLPYLSSESLPVIAARVINRLTGHYLTFDIRMAGFVHLATFLAAIYLLFSSARGLALRSRLISGKSCPALSSSCRLWDTARKQLCSLWVVGPFVLANIFRPRLASRRTDRVRVSVLLQFQATVALAAGLLFYAAILSDGNEFQKHPFVFNLSLC